MHGYKEKKDITQLQFFSTVSMIYSEMAQIKLEQGLFPEGVGLYTEAIAGLLKIGKHDYTFSRGYFWLAKNW